MAVAVVDWPRARGTRARRARSLDGEIMVRMTLDNEQVGIVISVK